MLVFREGVYKIPEGGEEYDGPLNLLGLNIGVFLDELAGFSDGFFGVEKGGGDRNGKMKRKRIRAFGEIQNVIGIRTRGIILQVMISYDTTNVKCHFRSPSLARWGSFQG